MNFKHVPIIDLTDPTRAYEVSGLLADRMAEIDLICPDGTKMDLRTWVRLTNVNLEKKEVALVFEIEPFVADSE